jgi:glycosyltransferase involved in cell wall biosynthesis
MSNPILSKAHIDDQQVVREGVSLRLPEHRAVLPPGEQVLLELQAARALVLPSFAEGLPVVIMEAMALGRPVISTFVAGIPELVQAGENGWLVPAGDVEALADAMQDCLESSTERLDAMGLNGRRRVLQRHDVNVEAAKLAGWFQTPKASTDKQP